MKAQFRNLALDQLDEKMKAMRPLLRTARPPKGWIKSIREALGMTSQDLARRLQVTQPSIINFENSEVTGSLSFHTAKKIAEAMDCVFVYAIVPKRPMKEMLQIQAQQVARNILKRVSHSMRLEEQGVAPEKEAKQVRSLAEEIVKTRRVRLWR